jgi:hypothetical protein
VPTASAVISRCHRCVSGSESSPVPSDTATGCRRMKGLHRDDLPPSWGCSASSYRHAVGGVGSGAHRHICARGRDGSQRQRGPRRAIRENRIGQGAVYRLRGPGRLRGVLSTVPPLEPMRERRLPASAHYDAGIAMQVLAMSGGYALGYSRSHRHRRF